MIRSVISRSAMALVLAASFQNTFAGVNAQATLAIDMNPGTTAVDSIRISATAEEQFWVALMVAGARNLDTYSIILAFDTARLSYTGTMEEDLTGTISAMPAFLTSNGGSSGGFFDVKTNRGPDTLEVVNSLVGSDTAQAPDGTGLIGLLRFRSKLAMDRRTAIRIVSADLGDSYQQFDRVAGGSNGLYRRAQPCTLFVSCAGGCQVAEGTFPAAIGDSVPISTTCDAQRIFAGWNATSGTVSFVDATNAATVAVLSATATVSGRCDLPTAVRAGATQGDCRAPRIERAANSGARLILPGVTNGRPALLRLFNSRGDLLTTANGAGGSDRETVFTIRSANARPGAYCAVVSFADGTSKRYLTAW